VAFGGPFPARCLDMWLNALCWRGIQKSRLPHFEKILEAEFAHLNAFNHEIGSSSKENSQAPTNL